MERGREEGGEWKERGNAYSSFDLPKNKILIKKREREKDTGDRERRGEREGEIEERKEERLKKFL